MEDQTSPIEELNQQEGSPAVGDQVAEAQPIEQPAAEAAPPPESDPSKNLRALREAREKAERERDELARQVQQMQQQQKPAPEEPQEYSVAPDALVEGKHLTKYDREIKALKEQLKNYQAQTSEQTTQARLQSQYPDFDKVVSSANINALRDAHPEIAQTLNSSTDLYNKAASAYKLIKSMGIYKEDTYAPQRDTVHANSNKPRPLTSVNPQTADSPLAHANAFATGGTRVDDMSDQQKQIYKEMQEIRKAN